MKNIIKSILVSIAILGAPFTAFSAQKDAEKKVFDLPTYKVEDTTLPIPVKVVAPPVGGRLVGTEVRMTFSISVDGLTHNIRQQGITPDQESNDLVAAMTMVLLNWEFEPAKNKNGLPVAVKVVLPVKVIRKVKAGSTYASLDWGKLELIRRTN